MTRPSHAVPSAAWPLQVALVERLLSYGPVAGRLAFDATGAPAVFDGKAPTGQALAYLEVGAVAEARADVFGRAGHAGAIDLHLWTVDRAAAASLHGAVTGALEGYRLVVPDHGISRGRVVLVLSVDDPDEDAAGRRAHHRVLRYVSRTRTALHAAPDPF